jgi:uncharacterized protein YijF (DUF1287 family)
VLNLQSYFQRVGAQVWAATGLVAGDAFPRPLAVGDILTWLLNSGQPHIGIVVAVPALWGAGVISPLEPTARVVHNIGRGAEESPLAAFWPHRATGHYRWPVASELGHSAMLSKASPSALSAFIVVVFE